MTFETLTFKSVDVRPVFVPFKRPMVSKVGRFDEWPMILIDLYTEEGIVGRSYLEPYLKSAVRYLVPAIQDFAWRAPGRRSTARDFPNGISSLNLVGREGMSLIAVAGSTWPRGTQWLKPPGMPLAVFLGGTLGPYPPTTATGSGYRRRDPRAGSRSTCRGRRLHRSEVAARSGPPCTMIWRQSRPSARRSGGNQLMVDFNQGLSLGDACIAVTRSMIRAFSGSRSRLSTTTSRATSSSPAS